eukprot:scaffold4809_cov116-Cylindrotheca_fusiformis.AAC.3
MCKSPTSGGVVSHRTSNKLLLTSLESFSQDDKGNSPSAVSKLFTIGAFVVFLIAVEHLCRQVLLQCQKTWSRLTFSYYYYIHDLNLAKDFHPLLQIERNRFILARHIGIDFVSAMVVSYFGFKARYLNQDMIDTVIHRKPNRMSQAYDNRLFKYHPESARVIVLFLGYQIKNSYDTMIWNDGALFIAHHVLAFFTAWGALFPGASHYYAPFFLGYSEFSTATLCLLANFDDDFGVKGLGTAFPMGKVIFGAGFAVSFIFCRVIAWSTMSYYYLKDIMACFKANDPRLEGRKLWFHCLVGRNLYDWKARVGKSWISMSTLIAIHSEKERCMLLGPAGKRSLGFLLMGNF